MCSDFSLLTNHVLKMPSSALKNNGGAGKMGPKENYPLDFF
jgi:hypothetical protein